MVDSTTTSSPSRKVVRSYLQTISKNKAAVVDEHRHVRHNIYINSPATGTVVVRNPNLSCVSHMLQLLTVSIFFNYKKV